MKNLFVTLRALVTVGLWIGWAALPGVRVSLAATADDAVQALAQEVRARGWIVFAGRSPKGDWDLFLCRPDGSNLRNLTQTPDYNEFSALISRDGRRMLYRRIPRSEQIDNNHHGTQGVLMLAHSDGAAPEPLGAAGEYPWASWSPDGRQFASLTIKGISLIDLDSRKVVRTFERKGFFQQVTWSPDGQWLIGVANSFGASWSIARMNLTTGEATAVNRVDCCTPDWFPDSQQVIFSWRPPGQQANQGYGWTQLWRADLAGKTRQLVYGEDGRHVYGGQVSPDGQYVLFTGNLQEDGDPGNAGAPMALMRLGDAPLIGGESRELRTRHPGAKNGPVLTLPAGWEPCWTSSEIPGQGSAQSDPPPVRQPVRPLTPALFSGAGEGNQQATEGQPSKNVAAKRPEVDQLARELHNRGWLVFSAKTDRGDWDLFRMGPDGSDRRPLTVTPEFNEAGARVSPDGKRLLYYRLPKDEAVDNNTYGTFELVLTDAEGRQPVVWGKGYPWASWGPGTSQLACLTPQGIQIVDLATRRVVRRLSRHGIVSQLVWAPDGKAFVGTANGLGPFWNIGRLDLETGLIQAVSETDRYNCTPDWGPDSRTTLYARGIIPQQAGRAELWTVAADGTHRGMLYAEAGRHIYGACSSPDGQYLLFTRSVDDLGKVDHSQTTLAVIRRSDAPMVGDADDSLRRRFPDAHGGPLLDLGPGWEPHWTAPEGTPPTKGQP